MPRSRLLWTEDQIMALLRARADGGNYQECGIACGHPTSSIRGKLDHLGANTAASARRVLAEGIPQEEKFSNHMTEPGPDLVPEQIEEQDNFYWSIAERDRDVTARLAGDPPPGRSALEQKRQRELAARSRPTISAAPLP